MPSLIAPSPGDNNHTYESNPFLNAAAGLRAILQYNAAASMLSGLVVVAVVFGLYALMFSSFFSRSGWLIFAGFLLYLVGIFLLIPYALGLYVIFAVKSGRGQTITIGQASSIAWSKIWPMVGLYLVVDLATSTALMFFVIPGLIFLARTILAPFYMLDENIGPMAAIDRSFRTTKGHTFELLGSIFAGMLMGGGYLLAPAVGMAPLLGRYLEIKQMEQSGAKKPKTHWLNYASVIGGLLIIGLIIGFYIFVVVQAITSGLQGNDAARTQAVQQAQDYNPPSGTNCPQIVTRAKHVASGAVFTFPTGCTPAGWVAEP